MQIQKIKSSFFDENHIDVTEDYGNFIYDSKINLKEKFISIGRTEIMHGKMNKQSHNKNILKTRFYVLFEDRIECYKNEDKAIHFYSIVLKSAKVYFFSKFEFHKGIKYSIIISKNKTPYIVYPQDEVQFIRWQLNLSKFCILSNYSNFYINQKTIGRGTYATVFMAQHKSLSSFYAVKTFEKTILEETKFPKRTKKALINEIHIMRLLNHKNIIKLHEVYEGKKHIYLVMDLLEGGDLFDRISARGLFTEKEAQQIIIQILQAILYLHNFELMHRDLKPENIIFKNSISNILRIADFGLSEFASKKVYLFKRCGTPGYVAPEILRNENYNTKVDLFSVGVILFILFSGYSPFFDESYDKILRKNRECNIDYEKVCKWGNRISDDAIEILKCLLCQDPSLRISAKQAINHFWFKTVLKEFEESTSPIITNYNLGNARVLEE